MRFVAPRSGRYVGLPQHDVGEPAGQQVPDTGGDIVRDGRVDGDLGQELQHVVVVVVVVVAVSRAQRRVLGGCSAGWKVRRTVSPMRPVPREALLTIEMAPG
ncbi:MAG: hypothetical protein ABIQ59_10790 [Nocardioidaceae bacterium]